MMEVPVGTLASDRPIRLLIRHEARDAQNRVTRSYLHTTTTTETCERDLAELIAFPLIENKETGVWFGKDDEGRVHRFWTELPKAPT